MTVPGLSLHVWTAAQDGRRFHFHVPAGDSLARADGEFPLPLVGRPVADGAPVPDGTVLVPGRLDWAAAHALAARACRSAGVSHFVHAGSDFARTTLAASRTLTAVHPGRGVAWLSFDGRTVPTGSWERGEIAISSADGRPLRARVELRPAWDLGEGIVGSTGVEPRHHVDPEGTPALVLRGLPCADYVVRFDLVERSADGTPVSSRLGSVPVSIRPDRLRAEIAEPRGR